MGRMRFGAKRREFRSGTFKARLPTTFFERTSSEVDPRTNDNFSARDMVPTWR